MTEAEWLVDESAERMLNQLATEEASQRKLRLFAVACCKRIQHVLPDGRSLRAIHIAERYADGEASVEDLHAACSAAWDAARNLDGHLQNAADAAASCAEENIGERVMPVMFCAVDALWITTREASDTEREMHPHILREIFGNPCRPVAFAPDWRTDTALTLARQMYESRNFSAMPILADALQDAGCDNEDILSHCRQPGEHVRGCWVVDLVLGKK